MTDFVRDVFGVRAVVCAAEGPTVCGELDAVNLIGHALAEHAGLVVIPVGRLDPGFFELATGVAGQVVGKFASYRFGLAIVGDIAPYLDRSSALRAFVSESNRGHQLWFVDDLAALEAPLGRRPPAVLR